MPGLTDAPCMDNTFSAHNQLDDGVSHQTFGPSGLASFAQSAGNYTGPIMKTPFVVTGQKVFFNWLFGRILLTRTYLCSPKITVVLRYVTVNMKKKKSYVTQT